MIKTLVEWSPIGLFRELSPKGRVGAGITIIAAAAVSTAVIFEHREIGDVIHFASGNSTPSEELIHNAIQKGFGRNVIVRCLPTEDMPSGRQGEVPAIVPTDKPWPIIRILESDCNKISRFATDPTNNNDVEVYSLIIAAHELSHEMGESDEGKASCYGLQRVKRLAITLGVTPEEAEKVEKGAAHNYEFWAEQEGLSDDYRIPDECRDGGLYDLDPSNPGIFPSK